jgi:membrane fusion protein, multidrug efflux system
MTEANTPAPAPTSAAAANTKRAKALQGVALVVLLGLAYGGYEWYLGRHEEATDNAYVQGNVVQITPQVGGTVTAIFADDTDFVKAGQALVQLDPADAQVALDQAAANLAQAVRQVRTLYANNSTLGAQVAVRESDIPRARTDLARANDDLARRQSLVGNGAVSKEELGHAQSQVAAAQNALAAAQAGVTAAREQLSSNQTLTDGTRIESHPSVLAAAAKLREAYLAVHRAALPAPVDGYVAKRTVQLGQRVPAGAPLMSLIPLNQLWVDANFKEVQLRNIRLGQAVKLTADVYGSKLEYTGSVVGMGAGTGAAFALLPAQNATGNWIKVVQRVPVRIALDAQQLISNPLRVGLSMEAAVDVSDQSGKSLSEAPHPSSAVQTTVYASMDQGAAEAAQKIIAANAGSLGTAGRVSKVGNAAKGSK